MELIKKFIYEKIAKKELDHDLAKQMLTELSGNTEEESKEEPIAVIGINGKFPKAKNLEEYWKNLCEGKNCVDDFPADRLDYCVSHVMSNPHYMEFITGGYLKEEEFRDKDIYEKGSFLEDVDKFDAPFFGIPPREAVYMDPNQRMFLETAWGAIEDAGYSKSKISGSRTGVFLGKDDTGTSFYKYMSKVDPMQLTGSWESIIASRLSYLLNLKGPSMMVDTACSSGLVAIHMAAESIRRKECEMAVAGGISLTLLATAKKLKGALDLSAVESADYRVRTFDKDADGTVWGEGIGVVVLKPLRKAIEDGDNIHAIVKGSAINNDGASNGLIAPDAKAQEDVIIKAWEQGDINPETISYIEAHGTGTVLGDPIEFKGLTNAFSRYTDKKQFCAIGSLKTNLGHLVAASGLASFIKVVLAMKHKILPPTINFNNPNPYINFLSSPLYINDILREWTTIDGAPRRAGISSFGFSGTNCHVVLEEYTEREQPSAALAAEAWHCLPISAKNEGVLQEYVTQYQAYVQNAPDTGLEAMCYTAGVCRDHYSHRLGIIFNGKDDLLEKLDALVAAGDLSGVNEVGVYYNHHKIISGKVSPGKGLITAEEKKSLTRAADGLTGKLQGKKSADSMSLAKLCELYADGAEVHWEHLYDCEKMFALSVPQYPLERIRYWTEPKEHTVKGGATGEAVDHPIIDYKLVSSMDEDIYVTEFSVDRFWVLNDHRIMGECVVSGTCYIEMVRAAVAQIYDGAIELKDFMFLAPFIVRDDEVVLTHTIIKKREGYLEFIVASKREGSDRWVSHVNGRVEKISDTPEHTYDVEEIRRENSDIIEDDKYGAAFGAFKFGRRWVSVQKVYRKEKTALIELDLGDKYESDLGTCHLHPGMLDNAINHLSQTSVDDTFLPFIYKSLMYYKPMTRRMYSYIRRREHESDEQETRGFDITLLDDKGEVIAEITDYFVKRAHNLAAAFSGEKKVPCHEITWVPETTPEGESGVDNSHPVLIFKGDDPRAADICDEVKSRGIECVEVVLGSAYGAEDYKKLFEDFKGKTFSKVVHTYGLSGSEPQSADDLAGLEEEGVYSLYHIVRGLINNKVNVTSGMAVVADYAHLVSEDDRTVKPHNSALLGLAVTAGQEYDNLQAVCIDVDDEVDSKIVVNEILAEGRNRKVAFRGDRRFVSRLSKIVGSEDQESKIVVKNGGVYLITGGTGGLGLETAKFLASRNKVKLCLVNRSEVPVKDCWDSIIQEGGDPRMVSKLKSLKEIEAQGSEVFCLKGDISNEDEMKTLLKNVADSVGVLNGIIHCAGVAGNGFIINRDEDEFRSVIVPKSVGTFILDSLTKDIDLDFFVLFSTITSLTGDQGQGDYTAAGAYLDAYASYGRKKGRPVVAVNWPMWSETGMAVDFGVVDDYTIFKSLKNHEALSALEYAVSSGKDRIIPGGLNYKRLSEVKGGLVFSLSEDIQGELTREEKKRGTESGGGGTSLIEVVLTGKSIDDISETENILAQAWGNVLGAGEINIYDSFQELGGDSILATHLLKAINGEFPGLLDISDIYSYPSIAAMAEYIDELQGGGSNAESGAGDSEAEEDKKLMDLLDNLDDEDVSIDDALEALRGDRG